MKKITFLILLIYLSCIIIPVSALTELLENGSFERGIDGCVYIEEAGQYLHTSETASSGDFSIYIFKRMSQSTCIQYDIQPILKQYGTRYYHFSASVKLNEPAFEYSKFCAVIKIITDTQEYIYKSPEVKIVNERFSVCESTTNLFWQGNILEAYLYLENAAKNEYSNVFIDDFSLSVSEENPIVTNPPAEFSSLQVGALRRDIWQDTCEESKTAASELLLERYHPLLPFHTVLQPEVRFGSYKDIMDIEIDFAAYAGLDFWAYYWLKEGGAYREHKESGNAAKVKMCFVVEPGLPKEALREMASYFSLNCYLKIQERPVLFLEGDSGTYEKISLLQQLCAEKGLAAPYIILITQNAVQSNAPGIDAVALTGGRPVWQQALKDTNSIVPFISCGMDKRNYQSPQEIVNHIKEAFSFYNTSGAGPGCILVNAWNKNAAGAWLSPTLCFDSKGNVLSEDGAYCLDTSRIDALHALLNPNGPDTILRRYGGTAYTPSYPPLTLAPGETPALPSFFTNAAEETAFCSEPAETSLSVPTAALDDRGISSFHFPVFWFFAAVLLAAGVIVLIILLKRKKKREEKGGNHGP